MDGALAGCQRGGGSDWALRCPCTHHRSIPPHAIRAAETDGLRRARPSRPALSTTSAPPPSPTPPAATPQPPLSRLKQHAAGAPPSAPLSNGKQTSCQSTVRLSRAIQRPSGGRGGGDRSLQLLLGNTSICCHDSYTCSGSYDRLTPHPQPHTAPPITDRWPVPHSKVICLAQQSSREGSVKTRRSGSQRHGGEEEGE